MIFTLAFSPGLYVVCRRLDLDVEHPLFRRDDDLAASRCRRWPSATVTASTKKLGMSFLHDVDLLDRALALELDAPSAAGRRRWPGRTNSSTVPSARSVLIMQLDLVAGLVFALVGDQFEVVEAELARRRSPRR